jgi:SAM-dependent methyltransferase
MIRSWVPWWFRILAKLVCARLPLRYARWARLRLFRHGDMDRPLHAIGVFEAHAKRAGLLPDFPRGATVLELGPGDSVMNAVIARTLGAGRILLVDDGDWAACPVAAYLQLTAALAERGLQPPDLTGCSDRAAILAACDATYLTEGLASLRTIPTGSIRFIFSNVVLEHLPQAEFADFCQEWRRVLQSDGVMSHSVDLRDHLGGQLHNLRFSVARWEAPWFARRSGFYTNRVRFSQMCQLIAAVGFTVEVTTLKRFARISPSPSLMAAPFRDLPAEELSVCEFELVSRPVAV